LFLGRQNKASGLKENPWAGWLTRFRTPNGLPLKKLADYQYYMQHHDFKSKVVDVFKERSVGVRAAEHLKLRAQIAKELLLAEPQEVQTMMKAEAEEEHAAQLRKREDAMEGLPAFEEEDLEE
jgi:hypothetical protein